MPHRLIDPARNPRLRQVLHIIGGLATGLFLVGAIMVIVQSYAILNATRQTQLGNDARSEDTKVAAEQAARTAQRIEDCTTPGRECFDDAQKRLGRTVGTINDYALYAAACADQPRRQTVSEIQSCILSEIKAARRAADRAADQR